MSSLQERFDRLTADLTEARRDLLRELIGDAQAAEGQLIQRTWSQRLAAVSRQASADMTEAIRQAKQDAWTACTNAQLEYAFDGDISVLDNPYEKKENELT